jgi:hypothetical protein
MGLQFVDPARNDVSVDCAFVVRLPKNSCMCDTPA